MKTDNRKDNFVDYTPAVLAKTVVSRSMCSKKEEVKVLDADVDGGDYNVEGKMRDPKMTVR